MEESCHLFQVDLKHPMKTKLFGTPPTRAEVIHTELAAEFVSYCDHYTKWGRIEVSWWGRVLFAHTGRRHLTGTLLVSPSISAFPCNRETVIRIRTALGSGPPAPSRSGPCCTGGGPDRSFHHSDTFQPRKQSPCDRRCRILFRRQPL